MPRRPSPCALAALPASLLTIQVCCGRRRLGTSSRRRAPTAGTSARRPCSAGDGILARLPVRPASPSPQASCPPVASSAASSAAASSSTPRDWPTTSPAAPALEARRAGCRGGARAGRRPAGRDRLQPGRCDRARRRLAHRDDERVQPASTTWTASRRRSRRSPAPSSRSTPTSPTRAIWSRCSHSASASPASASSPSTCD